MYILFFVSIICFFVGVLFPKQKTNLHTMDRICVIPCYWIAVPSVHDWNLFLSTFLQRRMEGGGKTCYISRPSNVEEGRNRRSRLTRWKGEGGGGVRWVS